MAVRQRLTCIAALALLAAAPGAALASLPEPPGPPCAGTAADGSIALSTRTACREETLQAVRSAVQTLNTAAMTPGPRPRQRRAEGAGIRTTPLHRLAPLPGRYYGQR